MVRLLFISDFTESFAYNLLQGILRFSEEKGEQWTICRMPPSYKKKIGITGVVKWAKKWKADVVIGQFDENDRVELFAKAGIIAFAQDYKQRFDCIPNITADYKLTGRMAAEHFLAKGFTNFGFFGYKNVCWSDERQQGFSERIIEAGYGDNIHNYMWQDIENLWYYETDKLHDWLKSIPKPIAIMACDDNQGTMLVEACNIVGIKVPSEIALIGVDNDKVVCSLSNPPLSSIQVDIETGGYQVAETAERMHEQGEFMCDDIVLLPSKVVPRVSSAAFATTDTEVLRAIQYIHQNLDKKIQVTDVLDCVPLSRRLLEIRFRKVTGESVYQYISTRRVELFAVMLLESNDSVVDIAFSLGEDDAKSISRRFKAIKGCTPQEWREKNSAK